MAPKVRYFCGVGLGYETRCSNIKRESEISQCDTYTYTHAYMHVCKNGIQIGAKYVFLGGVSERREN